MGLDSKACFAFAKQRNPDNLVCFLHEGVCVKTSVETYLEQKRASLVSVFIIFVGFLDTENLFKYYFDLLNILIFTVNIYSLAIRG